jgi:hypothetical protein
MIGASALQWSTPMSKIFAVAAISLTLIAGCTQTTNVGSTFGSQYGDTAAKSWPPKRHSQGGRG